MKTRISKASISIARSLAVPLGFLAAPNAVAAETSTVNEVSTSEVGDQLLFETEEQALALFSIIESIPDEVLEAGDAAMGGAIADLANEILGIKDVREKCFN